MDDVLAFCFRRVPQPCVERAALRALARGCRGVADARQTSESTRRRCVHSASPNPGGSGYEKNVDSFL